MKPEKTLKSCKRNEEIEIRAEELIIQIYKMKSDLIEQGKKVSRIVMPMKFYRIIKNYHLSLGELQSKFCDYIAEDEIFGIPIYIDQINNIIVE